MFMRTSDERSGNVPATSRQRCAAFRNLSNESKPDHASIVLLHEACGERAVVSNGVGVQAID